MIEYLLIPVVIVMGVLGVSLLYWIWSMVSFLLVFAANLLGYYLGLLLNYLTLGLFSATVGRLLNRAMGPMLGWGAPIAKTTAEIGLGLWAMITLTDVTVYSLFDVDWFWLEMLAGLGGLIWIAGLLAAVTIALNVGLMGFNFMKYQQGGYYADVENDDPLS